MVLEWYLNYPLITANGALTLLDREYAASLKIILRLCQRGIAAVACPKPRNHRQTSSARHLFGPALFARKGERRLAAACGAHPCACAFLDVNELLLTLHRYFNPPYSPLSIL